MDWLFLACLAVVGLACMLLGFYVGKQAEFLFWQKFLRKSGVEIDKGDNWRSIAVRPDHTRWKISDPKEAAE